MAGILVPTVFALVLRALVGRAGKALMRWQPPACVSQRGSEDQEVDSMETTKAQRRLLRELCAMAHEVEAREALASLDDDFRRWRDEEINSFDLIDAIHDFHQHRARELYLTYSSRDELLTATRAVRLGFIRADDVPAELVPLLQEQIDMQRGR